MKYIFNIKIHLIYGGVVSGYLPNGNFGIIPNKERRNGYRGKVVGYQKLVKIHKSCFSVSITLREVR
jgi:hypothetical protein